MLISRPVKESNILLQCTSFLNNARESSESRYICPEFPALFGPTLVFENHSAFSQCLFDRCCESETRAVRHYNTQTLRGSGREQGKLEWPSAFSSQPVSEKLLEFLEHHFQGRDEEGGQEASLFVTWKSRKTRFVRFVKISRSI